MGSGGAAPQRVLASGRRTRPRPHTARLFGGSSPTCTGRAARFKRSKRVAHARPRNSFVRGAAGIGLRRDGGRVLRLTRARGLRPFPAKLLSAGYLMLWRVRCTTESQLTPDELRAHGTNDLTADHDVLAHLERLLAVDLLCAFPEADCRQSRGSSPCSFSQAATIAATSSSLSAIARLRSPS